MKTLIVAGLLAITSVAALAESGNGETWGHQVASSGPSLTRAQVIAELREAQTLTQSAIPNGGQAVIIDIGEGKEARTGLGPEAHRLLADAVHGARRSASRPADAA